MPGVPLDTGGQGGGAVDDPMDESPALDKDDQAAGDDEQEAGVFACGHETGPKAGEDGK